MPFLTPALILSAITAAVSGTFVAIVLKRWLEKRREGRHAPHLHCVPSEAPCASRPFLRQPVPPAAPRAAAHLQP